MELGAYKLRFSGACELGEFRSRCAEQDYWYHSFYFDNGFEQRGDYDIGADIDAYGFPEDMNGMSVLDVGTGSGWFATYFEQRGADVTTVDARGYSDFDVFGRPGYGELKQEKPQPDLQLPDGRTIYYSPVSKGFWIMKEILGLRAEGMNARVYELAPTLFQGRTFDFVFMGALLMHLRDPIGALMAARSVCHGRLIATSFVLDASEAPLMVFSGGDPISWWTPNERCLVVWAQAAGFGQVDVGGRVKLTVDKPYVDEYGNSSAADQTHALIDAHV